VGSAVLVKKNLVLVVPVASDLQLTQFQHGGRQYENAASDLYIHAMGFWSFSGVMGRSLQVYKCHSAGEELGNFLWDLELYGSSIDSEIGSFRLNSKVHVCFDGQEIRISGGTCLVLDSPCQDKYCMF